jgi:hypothetical protein
MNLLHNFIGYKYAKRKKKTGISNPRFLKMKYSTLTNESEGKFLRNELKISSDYDISMLDHSV